MNELQTTDWLMIVGLASVLSMAIGCLFTAMVARSLMRIALNGALRLTEAVMVEDES